MQKKLIVATAQFNFVVGDILGNAEKHIKAAINAKNNFNADIIIFPELSLIGYPAEDLLLRKSFIKSTEESLEKIIQNIRGIYCLVGHPVKKGDHLFNACTLFYDGEILGQYYKKHLPNYGVFDEARYFTAGKNSSVLSIKGIKTGLIICEDLWYTAPTKEAVKEGAQLILSPNASPFEIDKHERRLAILSKRAHENQVPIVYTNQVGGQDDLIFDGGSMIVNSSGQIESFSGFCKENLEICTLSFDETNSANSTHTLDIYIPQKEERVYQALVLAVHDYITKNKFPGVIIGVSGGIDSALVLAIACDAIGSDRVKAVIMPSRYTQAMSIEDAQKLADNFKINASIISIEPAFQAFLSSLDITENKNFDFTEQNIQARVRAILLMALSNTNGHLVLTTGNRSELAVGYTTLYGDMAGGFAPLKDISKTLVYDLAKYRNSIKRQIPERILERAPTAELAPNQKDEDNLPPYSVLDPILELFINEGLSKDEIIHKGFPTATVESVINLIYKNEYKRKQSALGPHINHRSFGRDWRYPVTHCYKG